MTITKKKINKNNKTKKRFTSKIIPSTINDSLNKSYTEHSRETMLSCYLASNTKVKNFAFKIFCYMLFYWKRFYPKKWKTIIGDELNEIIDKNKIIQRIGFTNGEKNEILKLITHNKKEELMEYIQDKFLKVTSVLNNLSKPDFAFYHVNVKKRLQNEFINNLSKLFLIKNFNWNDFVKLYNSSPKTYRKSYNLFLFNIIVYGNNDNENMSLYKKNLVYFDFIKKSVPVEKKNKSSILKKIKECNKTSVSVDDYNSYSIYDARNFYEIDKKMPYAKIMDKCGQPYLGGPSGSTSILYISLFDFYGFPETKENKIMLLCVIIADYIPLWHTLTEILLSSNIELNKYVSNYELTENPVDYVDHIIKNYI
jgi:predicted house-cleaning noncanonical NTP pyrophosphatase (MazG superfamily)